MEKEQSIDWGDPAAVERMLDSEGLGDIDQEQRGTSDSAIIAHYAEATAGTDLEVRTIQDTLDRYNGDMVGAAIASHITGALAAELPLDGTVGEQEASVIDDVTNKIQRSGLSGITLPDIARYFGANFEFGGLYGLLDLREKLDELSSDDIAQLRAGMHIEDEVDEDEVSFDDELDDELEDEVDEDGIEDDSEDVTDGSEEYEF